MAKDIWAGVDFGNSIVNPGSVAQTYDPKTGQTTYGTSGANATAFQGVAASSAGYSAQGINAPSVATPASTPAGAPVYQGGALGYAPMGADTAFTGETPQSNFAKNPSLYPEISSTKDQAAKEEPKQIPPDSTGINALLASGRAFNETDAKNYAYSQGEANWQQYVGGSGGQPNPLYIGETNWAILQKTYTPYQLESATTRTKDGIYWNPDVNIADIPRVDPNVQINNDVKTVANLVADAKSGIDKFSKDDKPEIKQTAEENQQTLMDMLVGKYNDDAGAEAIYNELFNSPEMKAAQDDVIKFKEKNDEYDDMLEELKNDIRNEVRGEAPESYINALAAIRGEKILKLKRANQRDFDSAVARLNNLKENANNLLQVRTKDSDTRYNRLFQMLQLQIQQEGTQFNQSLALAQMALQMPEGRSMTIGGYTVTGLRENDNLNVVQFTESNGKTYVIGIDKKTGQQVYKEYIGTAKVGGGTSTTAVQILNEYKATQELERLKWYDEQMNAGNIAIDYDDKGNAFYYDVNAYNEQNAGAQWWNPFNNKKDTIDFRL